MTWSVHDRLRAPVPCGNRLVRLADVPFEQRRAAVENLVKRGEVGEDDAFRLFQLVLDPGDAGGRIAVGVEGETRAA